VTGVVGADARTVEDLYEDAPCGHVSTAPDGTIVRANRTFLLTFGLRAEDVVGRVRFADLLTPGSRVYHDTHVALLLHLQGAVGEVALELVDAEGRRRPLLVSSVLQTDAGGVPAFVHTAVFETPERHAHEQELHRVRTELAERNEELRRAAYTDPLTGVANRRAAEEHLEREVTRARRHGTELGVAILDVDHFKRINDGLGHRAGDAVLHTVAQRLARAVRREDLVGRWGGEEFVVVAPDAGAAGMAGVAERLRAVIADVPVGHGGHSVAVTVSVGWATWDGHSAEALLAAADRGLYAAKAAGRDAVRSHHAVA
jgi:diguanylate cyclase (GGDEF)-like protein/PAS domain S-box-containing protein